MSAAAHSAPGRRGAGCRSRSAPRQPAAPSAGVGDVLPPQRTPPPRHGSAVPGTVQGRFSASPACRLPAAAGPRRRPGSATSMSPAPAQRRRRPRAWPHMYCSTTLAGTRPRSLTSMPCSLAHSRTLAVSTAALPRRVRAALLVPPVRLACARYCCSAVRSSSLCAALRSISYSAPSRPKRTVPAASPPSRSSMSRV
jgi:hypothetical protein